MESGGESNLLLQGRPDVNVCMNAGVTVHAVQGSQSGCGEIGCYSGETEAHHQGGWEPEP